MVLSRATEYDTARQEFLALFPRRDAYIWKPYNKKRWEKVKGTLLDRQIIDAISDRQREHYRGCYWSEYTRHAVVDIDTDSKYHIDIELHNLQARLTEVGLYVKTYRSSDSGGWHLYLFFDSWQKSDEVSQTLKLWLKSLGYAIAAGTLEVFPSGNALRLPLQKGFGWLAKDGTLIRRREDVPEDLALAIFLHDMHESQSDWLAAKSLMDSQIQQARAALGELAEEHTKAISNEGFDELFAPGIILEKWQKGRDLWFTGLTEKDQRHEALLAVGHYLWYGDATAGIPAHPGRFNDQARARLIRSWLEAKHNGLSGHVANNNWHAIEADLQRAVSWRRLESTETSANRYAPYGQLNSEAARDRIAILSRKTGRTWTPEDWRKGNEKREKQARRKIQRAVTSMCAAGELLTRNAIAQKSGCSPNTVSKHRDLWKLLAARSGDISRGVLGGSAVLGSKKSLLDRPSSVADSQTNKQQQSSVAAFSVEGSKDADARTPVPPEVFTQGPLLEGLRAEGQMSARGVSNIWEKLKTQSEQASQSLYIQKNHFECLLGNYQNLKEASVFEQRKTLFILPYGALAASKNPNRQQSRSATKHKRRRALGTVQLSVPLTNKATVPKKARHSGNGSVRNCSSPNEPAQFYRMTFDAGGPSN